MSDNLVEMSYCHIDLSLEKKKNMFSLKFLENKSLTSIINVTLTFHVLVNIPMTRFQPP